MAMKKEIKLFSTQIETWARPLLIRAFDENDAEELTRALFKVPTDIGITATAYMWKGDNYRIEEKIMEGS